MVWIIFSNFWELEVIIMIIIIIIIIIIITIFSRFVRLHPRRIELANILSE